MDVSSLLGMVAPGIGAQPDLHSQWFAKNMAGPSAPQDMSAALLGMQSAIDSVPEPPLADNVRTSRHKKCMMLDRPCQRRQAFVANCFRFCDRMKPAHCRPLQMKLLAVR